MIGAAVDGMIGASVIGLCDGSLVGMAVMRRPSVGSCWDMDGSKVTSNCMPKVGTKRGLSEGAWLK